MGGINSSAVLFRQIDVAVALVRQNHVVLYSGKVTAAPVVIFGGRVMKSGLCDCVV